MGEISFSDLLAILGMIFSVVLVVLDKAGKLRGPILFVLLGLCAVMTLPLVMSISWVNASPSGMSRFARRMVAFFVVGLVYSLVAMWVSTGNGEEQLTGPARQEGENQALKDRHLTLEQANYLVTSISGFEGQSVVVNFVLGDTESQVYAEELTQVLENAHWNVRRMIGLLLTFRGIRITPQDPTDVPRAAEALMRGLSDQGISVARDYVQPTSFEYNGTNYVPTLYLFVGKNGKPTPIPAKYPSPVTVPNLPDIPADLDKMSNADLRDRAEQMATALQDYETKNRRQFESEWHIHGDPIMDNSYRGVFENQLRPRAKALRDEMQKRLGIGPTIVFAIDADALDGIQPLRDAANHLHELAGKLLASK